ncbi:MAG: zinc-ribbon domain-containing protein [Bacteroidetes bacterium]|nr:zinc-ribbon domain-containing protein [Bacteroidota bacterium]
MNLHYSFILVIFGFGHRTNKENQLRSISHCYHCNNDGRWILSKTTSWFTLFFIPVFPYKTEYLTYCPICKNGYKISREDYENKINSEIS